jgi:hypothetical protein
MGREIESGRGGSLTKLPNSQSASLSQLATSSQNDRKSQNSGSKFFFQFIFIGGFVRRKFELSMRAREREQIFHEKR